LYDNVVPKNRNLNMGVGVDWEGTMTRGPSTGKKKAPVTRKKDKTETEQTASVEASHDATKNIATTTHPTAPVRRPLSGPQEAVGQIIGLMLQSPLHKHLFLNELEWLVLPPVMLQQFRIIHRDGKPIAYASWARLSEDATARLKSGVRKLKPEDWNAEGGELWLIDLLTPFGGHEAVLKELKEKVFEGQTIKTLQPAPDGVGVAVVEW